MCLRCSCDRRGGGEGGRKRVRVPKLQGYASTGGHSGPSIVADFGPLCPADFMVGADTSGIFEEVACFATPSDVKELFRNMPVPTMFHAIEVSVVKV